MNTTSPRQQSCSEKVDFSFSMANRRTYLCKSGYIWHGSIQKLKLGINTNIFQNVFNIIEKILNNILNKITGTNYIILCYKFN